MLEIKHLTKIYHTKGGDTKALDDVSITFPENGLVFLLGKSGSGKSTLLNVAGGLDEPTSGEVIVKGKSSKEFSGSDFDSYRNTFVGFIFQEYNVLNEFNVEDNIALALELQGKPKNKEKIAEILRQVDLESFAKRKPNTLSGGQKQRIAIARALVKDPEIIMADEPTGALDSTTGKQVFDTLKSLSADHLVIVVSHDREFAEIYGDRIVELKDGQIISDVSKTTEAAHTVGTVTRIGTDTLSIRRDKPLDKATIDAINSFLAEGDGEVIITKDASDIASFKRANRIDDENGRERFQTTPPQEPTVYDGSKTKFIRSKLPARKAIKIGAAGLKLKPFRLIFTILLSFVAFAMFGLFSTLMLYDRNDVAAQAFMESDYDYVMLNKYYEVRVTSQYNGERPYTYTNRMSAKFTPAEVDALGGKEGFGYYSATYSSSNFDNLKAVSNTSDGQVPYYRPTISAAAVLKEGHPLRETIVGKYPTKSDEICISSYLFDCMKNMLFTQPKAGDPTSSTEVKVNSEQDVIGKKLILGKTELTITGVFQSGELSSEFDTLKTAGSDKDQNNRELLENFSNTIEEGLHAVILGVDGIQEIVRGSSSDWNYINYFDYSSSSFGTYRPLYEYEQDDSGAYITLGSEVSVYSAGGTKPVLPALLFGGGAPTTLKDDEILVSASRIRDYYAPKMDTYFKEQQQSIQEYYETVERPKFDAENPYPQWEDYEGNEAGFNAAMDAYNEKLNEFYNRENEAVYAVRNDFDRQFDILSGGYYDSEVGEYVQSTDAERTTAAAYVQSLITSPLTVKLYRQTMDYSSGGPSDPTLDGTFKIVGFFYSLGENSYNSNGIYGSQKFYDNAGINSKQTSETKYVAEKDATFSGVFAPVGNSKAAFSDLLAKTEVVDPDTDVYYSIHNSLYSSIDFVNSFIDEVSIIFLIIGIVLAVFAALLLLNFISMSISNKKKEIGILRAVGARGTDVFKIFFAESGIIVGICTVLALVASFVVCNFLNSFLKADAGLQITLFSFGFVSVAMMLGIALVVAFLGTFLPVYLASRKKPVDSIRAL